MEFPSLRTGLSKTFHESKSPKKTHTLHTFKETNLRREMKGRYYFFIQMGCGGSCPQLWAWPKAQMSLPHPSDGSGRNQIRSSGAVEMWVKSEGLSLTVGVD